MSGAVSIGPRRGAEPDLPSQASFRTWDGQACLNSFLLGSRSAGARLCRSLSRVPSLHLLVALLLTSAALVQEISAAGLTAPIITSFTPNAGHPGALVIINGSNLTQV